MVPYFAIYLFLGLGALRIRNRKEALALSCVFMTGLLIFMGTRFETGCDFSGYLRRFEILYAQDTLSSLLTLEEPGFHLLNYLVVQAGLGYMWLNIFSSAIFLACVYKFARISPRPLLVLTAFFPILVVQLGMSGLRQALATAFLLLAFVAFTDRRALVCAAWVVVAAQFHSSAYIFLPIAAVANREVSLPRLAASLVALGPVAILFLGQRTSVYSDRYIEQIYGENAASGAILRYAMILLPAILFELHRNKLRILFPSTFSLMRLFSIITFALFLIGIVSTVALHRLVYYMMPVSILILVSLSVVGIPWSNKKSIVFIVGFYGAYLFVWFLLSRHADYCYVPYRSYLF